MRNPGQLHRSETMPATELLSELLGDHQVYADLSAEDLREMAKFDEQPNVLGLAAHGLRRIPGVQAPYEVHGSIRDLNPSFRRRLHEAIHREPLLCVRGSLAGASRSPFQISAYFAQDQAHLAAGLQAILWPAPAGADFPSAHLHIIQICDSPDVEALFFPAESLLLLLGSDDLRPALMIALELAHRAWRPPSAAEPPAEDAPAPLPEILLLPGGSFALTPDSAPSELVYSGDAMPVAWEKTLAQKLAALYGRPGAETILAGAEPWVAQTGGWTLPLWFNPPLPARLLGANAAWREAACHPDALPFGVEINGRGEIDFKRSPGEAFVIVPRRAMPPPFARSAAPVRIGKVSTHKHARPEALELWAMGFPPPVLI